MSGVEEAALVGAVAPELIAGLTGTAAAGTAAAAGAGAGALGAGALGAGAAGAAGAGTGMLAGGALAGTGAAAADGALLAGAGAGMGEGAAAAGTGMLATAPEAAGTMAYTTPSLFAPDAITASQASYAANGSALDGLAAAQPGYAAGGDTALNSIAADQGMGGYAGYAKDLSKASTAYNTMNGAVGGTQPQHAAPAPRPVFQGEAPQIARQQQQPHENQFARMLLEQRKRGMLG